MVLNHPVKALYWVGLPDNRTAAGGASARPQTYLSTGTAQLKLNGHDRFAQRQAPYVTNVQRYEHHSGYPASFGTAATSVGSSGTALTSVNGAFVTVGGSSSPALLAKDFLKLFAEHNHPSSVGPTGPLSPQFASKLIQTMSKKVFLS